jgi:hypothetical protein
MFWMAKTEALISAVERRCIRAIERAGGGAGRLDYSRLSMESWTLCFGEKLYAWNIIAVSK